MSGNSVKSTQREVTYGVTDRRGDDILTKLNDWLIDHSGVPQKQKGLFFNSLHLLVNSGVRISRSLEMLTRRVRNPRLQRILRTIAYDMQSRGQSFSVAMSKYPDVFRPSEAKMIYSGELTGRLEKVLGSVATQIQRNIEMRMRVQNALMYPIVVMCAIILAGIVVMLLVVPQFQEMFSDFGSELPLSTRMLIGSSELFQEQWLLVLTGVAGAIFLFRNWLRSDEGRHTWDGWVLEMPLIKTLANNIQTTHIASNLATLMQSGLPIPKALHILGEISKNVVIKDAMLDVQQRILKGEQLHAAFAAQPLIDPVLHEVIEIGEKSGAVPEILGKTAHQYELEVEAQLKNLTTVLEPAIILLVGLAVVFMAFAIMTPIFKMQELFAAVG